jgi:hypothetical protein
MARMRNQAPASVARSARSTARLSPAPRCGARFRAWADKQARVVLWCRAARLRVETTPAPPCCCRRAVGNDSVWLTVVRMEGTHAVISSSDWCGSWRSFARWNARGLRFAIVRLTTKLRWPRRKPAKGEENPVRERSGPAWVPIVKALVSDESAYGPSIARNCPAKSGSFEDSYRFTSVSIAS